MQGPQWIGAPTPDTAPTGAAPIAGAFTTRNLRKAP
jgi:hypothetical protein